MRVIKKYNNRRLYDTSSSAYVNLDGLADLIRSGERVQILDARSGEDLTRAVLVQVLLEAQGGLDVLPIGFLHRMVRMGGSSPVHALFRRQMATGLDLLDQQVTRMEEQFNLVRPDHPPPSPAPSPAPSAPPPPEDDEDDDAPGPSGGGGGQDAGMDALRARLAALEARLGGKGR